MKMDSSPLTRQAPPQVFQPKIVQLYESLFEQNDGDTPEKSDGFWTEFFLLRADVPALRRVLDELGPGELALQHEVRTRELFARAVGAVKAGRGVVEVHSLETLAVFLSCILGKKFAHASSSVIELLAGINRVDVVFTEFVGALDGTIRNGREMDVRQKAVGVALAVTAGAYQTSLLTYLIQRDMFPSIMKFIADSATTDAVLPAFTILGLLANYNKFEFRNPYQLRLADFVNEPAIQRIVRCVGAVCCSLRGGYVDVQDDGPDRWSLSDALRAIGLGGLAGGDRRAMRDEETAKQMFAKLPGPEAALLLATYDFTHTNKLFCYNLVTLPAETPSNSTSSSTTPAATAAASDSTPSAPSSPPRETPFTSFISLTSYLLHHAHVSPRATLYAHLNLTVLRLLVEDPALCRWICAGDDARRASLRLCRQRPPYLPVVRGARVPVTGVLDCMIAGIDHNLRRRLDVGLHTLCVGIVLRVVSYLSRSRTRLAYHWNELFRSLLSLIRFLTTYASDLRGVPQIETLLDHAVNVVALSLSAGEAFLPSAREYDDLFYKVVEASEMLAKFEVAYGLAKRGSNGIDTLLSVCTHYKQQLLGGNNDSRATNSRDEGKAGIAGTGVDGSGAGAKGLTSSKVAEVIKVGYETLSLQTNEGLDSWERFREADERSLLKKVARVAVGDARALLDEGGG